jgi:hypothetical protein
MTRQKIQGTEATFYGQVDQELHRQCSRKKADEGALRLRDIKESASYDLPTLSDSKRVRTAPLLPSCFQYFHMQDLYRCSCSTLGANSSKAEATNTALMILKYTQELSRPSSGRSSLANFLSASITEYVPKISCKLSEDILRCISAVYCKLASRPKQESDLDTPSTPCFSSSSSSFPLKYYTAADSWSPRCHYNAADTNSEKCGSIDGNSDKYPGMIIFPRVHIDQDKFEYASKMLDTIR